MIFLLKVHQLGHWLHNIWKRTIKKGPGPKIALLTVWEIMGIAHVRLALRICLYCIFHHPTIFSSLLPL